MCACYSVAVAGTPVPPSNSMQPEIWGLDAGGVQSPLATLPTASPVRRQPREPSGWVALQLAPPVAVAW